MGQLLKSTIYVLAGFIAPIALAGIAYAIARSNHSHQTNQLLQPGQPQKSETQAQICQTLLADLNPPINIRSSPAIASDNNLSQLPNGTPVQVVNEHEGWLQINQPVQGWVYKELTVTQCQPSTELPQRDKPALEPGANLLAIATEQYQSGNINGAIALAKTVAADSPTYPTAKVMAAQWQKDWNQAEASYYIAQKAARDGRWQDVLAQVKTFPDNRHWKEKLAPMVKQAVEKSSQN